MVRSSIRRARFVAALFAAAGCSSTTDRVLSIESYPPGASVRLLVEGRAAGQTPLERVHVGASAGKSEVLLIEKENYQTVAYPVLPECPDHLFFSLQKAADLQPLQNAVNELQGNVRSIRETVEAVRDAQKRGGN